MSPMRTRTEREVDVVEVPGDLWQRDHGRLGLQRSGGWFKGVLTEIGRGEKPVARALVDEIVAGLPHDKSFREHNVRTRASVDQLGFQGEVIRY